MIDVISLLLFVVVGAYYPVMSYLKQTVFQGHADYFHPMTYLKDPMLAVAPVVLLAIGLGGWGLEAYLRTKLQFSQMYAWSAIIATPVTIAVTLFTFWLSEKYLMDKINWWAALICVIGVAVAAYGAQHLLG